MKEPKIHSHITDGLSENDNNAYKCVYCNICSEMLHCSNNECMQTWIETGEGNFCFKCFSKENREVLNDTLGIKQG